MPAVTEATSLESSYASGAVHAKKTLYAQLAEEFEKCYGAKPALYARSPGRVNLIGEHIDYEGYSVLPMALEIETVVAIRKADHAKIRLRNLDPKYAPIEFEASPEQAVDTANHSWGNYFICGLKGVYEHLEAAGMTKPAACGLDVLVHGNVPAGSGLSSSAAFVCATALAIVGVHGLSLDKADVADLACKGERHVGTLSGGMDQAISIMGELGVAKLIDFNPVRATDVPLPEGGTFVIANSLAVSKKAETAAGKYNLRVVECRLASVLLGVALGVPLAEARALKTLCEVEEIAGRKGISGKPALVDMAKQHLHVAPYSKEELEGALGVSLEKYFDDSPHSLPSIPAGEALGGFKLQQRAAHVYAEAGRVVDFKAACDGGKGLAALGSLMNESHESCSGLYECSAPELEELVGLCRAQGAIGSRLTGAGWGGCTVTLVDDSKVESFIAAIKEGYYSKRVADGTVRAEDVGTCIFASKPASGGAILRI